MIVPVIRRLRRLLLLVPKVGATSGGERAAPGREKRFPSGSLLTQNGFRDRLGNAPLEPGTGENNVLLLCGTRHLVLPSINTVTFAEGAWEVRSRSDDEAMQRHRRRGARRDRPQPPSAQRVETGHPCLLCGSSSPMSPHRLVVAPGIQGRRVRNKQHRIYGSEHLATGIGVNEKFLL